MSHGKESFRWDDLQNQPHNELSYWQKLWGSRHDLAAFAHLLKANLGQLLPVLGHYRRLLASSVPARPVGSSELGLAISPTVATWSRYEDHLTRLGVRSVLLRIPVWEPEPVWALAKHLEGLRARGIGLTFVLVQDREAVTSPARWSSFVLEAVQRLGELRPTFQVGQALNRKKWGIWRPDEYMRLVEGTAPARSAAPRCRFIGPAVIDFEYHFTIDYLSRPRPFDFDGITSLLYVDRRGSPDATQYGHFDLHRKILLLKAVVEASTHPPVPLVLTEFNWPLRGFGPWAPAGHRVQIDEARQARYLLLYYLGAVTTGVVEASYWWQLVARGYGLLTDDDTWTSRPAYCALATLLRRLPGWHISTLPQRLRPMRGYLLQHGGEHVAVAYSAGAPLKLTRPEAILEARSAQDEPVPTQDLSLGSEPLYLCFGQTEEASVLEALAPR